MHNHEPGEPLEGADVRLPALQSVADPAPLGLAAFAMTTFALSLIERQHLAGGHLPALALALVYGGFAQLLAGMWEFVRKNTFGALAFTSYGAFWISYYVFVKFLVGALKPALVPSAAGVFLLGWTIFTFYNADRLNAGVGSGGRRVLRPDHHVRAAHHRCIQLNSTITHIGGWAGIVTAALAWYASAAGVINETFKKALVPVFPLAPR